MPITEQMRDKIEALSSLPTLPEVVSRLLQMVNDPETSAKDVASLVGQDISLSAKVLRLANSAFYGMPRKINSINTAIVILGFRIVSTLVLSLTVFDIFPQDKKTPFFDRRAFWRHSLGCAIIAKYITSRMRRFVLFDPEEAFCAGLLHDIGKVVMEQYLHDDFREALKNAFYRKQPIYESEKTILGYTHTDVAEWLTSRWNLPEALRGGIVYHHEPQQASQDKSLATLCHYSDFLYYDMKLNGDCGYVGPSYKKDCVEQLGISPDVIETLKTVIDDEIEKASVFFDIVGP